MCFMAVLIDGTTPKIADFGLSRLRSATVASSTMGGGGAGGTPYYMAPELLMVRDPKDGKRYGVDVYAFAIVVVRAAKR